MRILANQWMMTMSREDFKKGRRDGRMGVYQPPYQRVFGPRSTSSPKEIEQAREDYRLGYMIGQKEKLDKESSQQGLPMWGTPPVKRIAASLGPPNQAPQLTRKGQAFCRVKSYSGAIHAD